MEENEKIYTLTATNLSKQNFVVPVSINIDNNVNIGNILSINSYISDPKIEAKTGSAVLTGTLGVGILYVDTDGQTNNVDTVQNISQTLVDNMIKEGSNIVPNNIVVSNNVVSKTGGLKLNCEITFSPIMSTNVGINNSTQLNNMVVKKHEIESNLLNKNINSTFEYSTTYVTTDKISKVLSLDGYFCPETIKPIEGKLYIEGKLHSNLVYETDNTEDKYKELNDTISLKTDLEADINNDSLVDVNFYLLKDKTSFTLEPNNDETIINATFVICAQGNSYNKMSIDLIEDMYSTQNEIETTCINQKFNNNIRTDYYFDNVNGDFTINDDDAEIEKILTILNIQPEITNYYPKDNFLSVEGIISSDVLYLDEEGHLQSKRTEIPFVLNSKIKYLQSEAIKLNIYINNSKARAKRGKILELEYSVCLVATTFDSISCDIVSDINILAPLDYSNADYQIFLAKPNETKWELCKRIKISPEEFDKTNSNLSEPLVGGEKIIIKR